MKSLAKQLQSQKGVLDTLEHGLEDAANVSQRARLELSSQVTQQVTQVSVEMTNTAERQQLAVTGLDSSLSAVSARLTESTEAWTVRVSALDTELTALAQRLTHGLEEATDSATRGSERVQRDVTQELKQVELALKTQLAHISQVGDVLISIYIYILSI